MTIWTSAEINAAFTAFEPVFAPIALFFSVISLIAFYKFPRQRVFPASILAWLVLFNLEFLVWMLLKWTPSSPLHDLMINQIKNHPPLCRFSVFIDQFHYYATVGCNTLITLTLYLSICRRVPMEKSINPAWFWTFLGFAILWPTVLPVIVGTAGPVAYYGVCFTQAKFVYVMAIPQFFFIAIQLIFLILAFRSMQKIISDASSSRATKHDSRMASLIIRFMLAWAVQIMCIIPPYVRLLWSAGLKNKEISLASMVTNPLACLLDALILLLGNKHFMRWMHRTYCQMRGIPYSTNSSENSLRMTVSNQSESPSPARATCEI